MANDFVPSTQTGYLAQAKRSFNASYANEGKAGNLNGRRELKAQALKVLSQVRQIMGALAEMNKELQGETNQANAEAYRAALPNLEKAKNKKIEEYRALLAQIKVKTEAFTNASKSYGDSLNKIRDDFLFTTKAPYTLEERFKGYEATFNTSPPGRLGFAID